jgi:hypothetical protein
MAKVSEDAVRAAMGPGITASQATFDEVAEQMSDRSPDDIHAELVKRLQAEPFAWDDEELHKIAALIGEDDERRGQGKDADKDADTDADDGGRAH